MKNEVFSSDVSEQQSQASNPHLLTHIYCLDITCWVWTELGHPLQRSHCSEADPQKSFDQEPLIAERGGAVACMSLLVRL